MNASRNRAVGSLRSVTPTPGRVIFDVDRATGRSQVLGRTCRDSRRTAHLESKARASHSFAHHRDCRSMARYIKGGPLGNSRLLSIGHGQVRFCYRLSQAEGGDGKRQGIESLPIETLIGRWLQHVPPRRFRTIRGYGLYSGKQHSCLQEAAEALGVEPGDGSSAAPSRSWQDWCEAAGMTAACHCPKCGKRLVSHHEFAWGRAPPLAVFSYREEMKPARIA